MCVWNCVLFCFVLRNKGRPWAFETLFNANHVRSIHPHKCHLCGWIERIPGGARENDGLETGIMEAAAARIE